MHKIIALSCARTQNRQGHVTVVGRFSVTILNRPSKVGISGDVTEEGRSRDFCDLRKGTERGFAKDWKRNKCML
jgi:hypothetical protein